MAEETEDRPFRGGRTIETLLLDLIERATALEMSSKFADQQRLDMSRDIRELVGNYAKEEDVKALRLEIISLQKTLADQKEVIDAHERFIKSGKAFGVKVWIFFSAIITAAITLVLERFIQGKGFGR